MPRPSALTAIFAVLFSPNALATPFPPPESVKRFWDRDSKTITLATNAEFLLPADLPVTVLSAPTEGPEDVKRTVSFVA